MIFPSSKYYFNIIFSKNLKFWQPCFETLSYMPNYFTNSFILQDWSSVTSKGCFFYEDDEIVTHVYNLKLTEDSAVYFTAYPLQEPASCKFMTLLYQVSLDSTFCVGYRYMKFLEQFRILHLDFLSKRKRI